MRKYESVFHSESWSVEELQEKPIISLVQLNPIDPSKISAQILLT
jgi:hypothetical protein